MKKLAFGLLALCSSMSSHAVNPAIIDFVVQQAHNNNFRGCDTAIREIYHYANGSDARVDKSWFDDTKDNTLKITAIFGDKGDAVFSEAELTKHSGNCYVTNTAYMPYSGSCEAYANDSTDFRFVERTADVTLMESSGGIKMYLQPLNGGCVVLYQRDTFFPQDK